MKDKLTHSQKDLVKEALLFYRDNVIKKKADVCAIDRMRRRSINKAIEKIERLL